MFLVHFPWKMRWVSPTWFFCSPRRNGPVMADYQLNFLIPEEGQDQLRNFTLSREMVYNVFRQSLYDQEPNESEPMYIDPVSLKMVVRHWQISEKILLPDTEKNTKLPTAMCVVKAYDLSDICVILPWVCTACIVPTSHANPYWLKVIMDDLLCSV